MSPSNIVFGIVVIAVAGFLLSQQFGASPIQSVQPSDLQPAPIRHGTLSAELVARVKRIEPIFAEVYPRSHEEWLDDFKRDLDPEPEVAIWEAIASAYQTFTMRHTLSLDAKKEALGLLLVRSAADEQNTLSGAKLRYLSAAEAQELVRLYSATPQPVQILKK